MSATQDSGLFAPKGQRKALPVHVGRRYGSKGHWFVSCMFWFYYHEQIGDLVGFVSI